LIDIPYAYVYSSLKWCLYYGTCTVYTSVNTHRTCTSYMCVVSNTLKTTCMYDVHVSQCKHRLRQMRIHLATAHRKTDRQTAKRPDRSRQTASVTQWQIEVHTANAASDLAQKRVVNSERLVAGDRRSSTLDVDPGRLLPAETRHIGVVAIQTPRRARIGALWSRLAAAYTTLHGNLQNVL